MSGETNKGATGMLTLEDWQHWTLVMGRAQQMLMEAWAEGLKKGGAQAPTAPGWGAFPPAFSSVPVLAPEKPGLRPR